MFGLIDRGSNLIQVRPTTVCNMNCPFCSTDGGALSSTKKTNYFIEPHYLLTWIKEIIKLKGNNIHINIDSVGEPTAYPNLVEVITELKKLPEITFISMQTNGTLLTKEKIDALEQAGLNRIHLSVHSLDSHLAKELFGHKDYNILSITELAEYITKSKIELLLAPVWLPKVNDAEIEKVIQFAKKLNCKIGIQKYESYKYGRQMEGAEFINYYKFYKQLREWQKKYDIKLVYRAEDLNVARSKKIPLLFEVGDKLQAIIKAHGWYQDQMIAAAKNRAITINNCHKNLNDKVNLKIIENKNSIYLAEMI